MRWHSIFLLFLAALVLVCGCAQIDRGAAETTPAAGDDDNDNDDDSAPYAPCDSGGSVAYSLDAGATDIPYPNNLFTVADSSAPTGLRVRLVGKTTRMLDHFLSTGFLRDGLNAMDGFGTATPIWVTLNDAPNLDTFSYYETPSFDDGALLIRLGTDAAHDALTEAVAAWTPGDKLLALTPRAPLEPATRYALVITDRAHTAAGRCFGASATFDRLRRGRPANDAERRAAESFGDLFDRLAAHGIDSLAVSAAAVFTTQDLRRDMEYVRDYVGGHTAPAIDNIKVQSPPAGWKGVSELIVATLHAQSWRDANGAFERDAQGTPQTFGDEKLETWIALPLPENAKQPMPIVVFQYGFMADKTDMQYVAPWLCAAGYAVAGIDLPEHGTRNTLPAFMNGWGYIDIFHPLAWRDNGRQAAADQMSLARGLATLANLDVWPAGGDGQPDLDVNNIFFLGHSLGGTTGAIASALDPTFKSCVLHAAFADFHSLVVNNIAGQIVVYLLQRLHDAGGPPLDDRLLQFFDLYFSILEPGMPLGYAPLFGQDQFGGDGPPEALFQVNAFDPAVPPASTYLLLGTAGVPLMTPLVYPVSGLGVVNSPFTGTAGFQYLTMVHDSILGDPSNPIFAAMDRQVVDYFNSKLATGTAQAIKRLAIFSASRCFLLGRLKE